MKISQRLSRAAAGKPAEPTSSAGKKPGGKAQPACSDARMPNIERKSGAGTASASRARTALPAGRPMLDLRESDGFDWADMSRVTVPVSEDLMQVFSGVSESLVNEQAEPPPAGALRPTITVVGAIDSVTGLRENVMKPREVPDAERKPKIEKPYQDAARKVSLDHIADMLGELKHPVLLETLENLNRQSTMARQSLDQVRASTYDNLKKASWTAVAHGTHNPIALARAVRTASMGGKQAMSYFGDRLNKPGEGIVPMFEKGVHKEVLAAWGKLQDPSAGATYVDRAACRALAERLVPGLVLNELSAD